jgi:MinD-like ATPase involved in chromosome partitioning or flagellar assembly
VGVLDAGHMPADENVPLAVRKRTPFVMVSPRAAASHAIAQLAMRLEQGVGVKSESGGFFNRMFGWLRR